MVFTFTGQGLNPQNLWPVSPCVQGQLGSLATNCIVVTAEVLHYLKKEVSWKNGFADLRMFSIGDLRSIDPAEIEPVVTPHNVAVNA